MACCVVKGKGHVLINHYLHETGTAVIVQHTFVLPVGHSTGQWVTAQVSVSQYWLVGHGTGQWVTALVTGSQH